MIGNTPSKPHRDSVARHLFTCIKMVDKYSVKGAKTDAPRAPEPKTQTEHSVMSLTVCERPWTLIQAGIITLATAIPVSPMIDRSIKSHELSTQARSPIPKTKATADINRVADMPKRLLIWTANRPKRPKISPGNEVSKTKIPPPKFKIGRAHV